MRRDAIAHAHQCTVYSCYATPKTKPTSKYSVVLFKSVALKSLKPRSDEDIVSHALRGSFHLGVCVGGENANPSLESYNGAGAFVRLKHRSGNMQLAIFDGAILTISIRDLECRK